MKIERRVLAAALVTIGLTAALQPSPVWAQAAPAPVPMTLISQSNEAGFPLWLAKKLGYFSENGIDATISTFRTEARHSLPARPATGRAAGSARLRRSRAGPSSA